MYNPSYFYHCFMLPTSNDKPKMIMEVINLTYVKIQLKDIVKEKESLHMLETWHLVELLDGFIM